MPDDDQNQGGDQGAQGAQGDQGGAGDQGSGDQGAQGAQGAADEALERVLAEIRDDPAEAFKRMEALRSEAAALRRRLRSSEQEIEKLKRAGMDDQERVVAEAEARGREAAEQAFSRRTLEAEIRAAAAGKLQDPADAIRYLDVDELLKQDDSDRELPKAIAKLVEDKPYLAVPATDDRQSSRGVPRTSQGARSGPGDGQSADKDGSAWLRKAAGRR